VPAWCVPRCVAPSQKTAFSRGVRIPYGPFLVSLIHGFGLSPWVRLAIDAAFVRGVQTPVRFEIDVVVIGPVTASGMFEAGTIQQVREFSTLVNNVQKSRWASVYHKTTPELAWADGDGFDLVSHPEITDASIGEGLLAAAREIPGGSWSKIRANENVRGNATECARVRYRLIATGQLVNTASREGYFNL
jgi:hypothetical protein